MQPGLTACRACVAIQHTVAVPVPHQIPRFQVWGLNPSQDLFLVFPFFQLSATVNQWRVFLNNFIDWLIWVVIPSHITKLFRLRFEPQTWKRGIWRGSGTATVCWFAAHARHARCRGKQGKRPMTAYFFTQCSNGCSLGSLLCLGQDNHVQRCTSEQKTSVSKTEPRPNRFLWSCNDWNVVDIQRRVHTSVRLEIPKLGTSKKAVLH